MPDINLKVVESTLKADFRAHGQGSSRFGDALVTSTNMAIGRINRQANLSSRIQSVSNMDGTIALDVTYLDILIDAIGLNLMALGQRPAKGKETKYQMDWAVMDDRIDDIRQDILQQAVEADPYDQVDFIGIGALG